uniref:Uncharacterized protein n=1 Tax=Ixodes scapularis TaxID=6945 RepID=A0A4D5RDH0_IXOSC
MLIVLNVVGLSAVALCLRWNWLLLYILKPLRLTTTARAAPFTVPVTLQPGGNGNLGAGSCMCRSQGLNSSFTKNKQTYKKKKDCTNLLLLHFCIFIQFLPFCVCSQGFVFF